MGALTDAASGGGRGLGGLPRQQVAARVAKSREALLAVMGHLGHQHVPDYEREPLATLEKQVRLVARCFVDTWSKTEKPHLIDVVAMAVLECGKLDASLVHRIFGGFSLECDLTAPVDAQLRKEGLQVAREVVVRGSRADLVGYGRGVFERCLIAVELKNAPEECERLAGQVADYRRAADSVRVIMSPECLARTSLARGELAAPVAFAEFVAKMGAELWTLDSTTGEIARIKGASPGAYVSADYESLWRRLTSVELAA
ncbi:hypothetical protein [Myxococcus xanthus]|uniref:hypothetical protein n=1 Tax=Myxococcus xanthus TaxID=34 RepID=UPI000476CA57|nr:hypothetical protein [Myxococcus xanthus]QZZ49440.1 hypothetical protein MyxoNM_09525 [Myxococcus xanthus]UYI16518.1 hypothetical protein N3T43_09425 [Myxococcus xanthus]UYI23881.1 hypothetical protein N1129_09430 [Myxococcus xanthus]SDY25924.1 hypothetical protein SAMN05444383_12826 [Myxococcus xanthus]